MISNAQVSDAIIYESFKSQDHFIVELEKPSNKDTFGLYNNEKQRTIFKFY